MIEAEQGTAAAVWVALDVLSPWAGNPRDNRAAVARVAESIRRFGFGAPIVASSQTSEIIAGHTRWLAAKSLGLATVPVRWLDLSPAEAHALALADNKLGEIASWNADALAEVMRDLDLDLRGATGFSVDEIARLIAAEPLPGDEDQAPEPRKSQPADSVVGRVYDLGPHRLLCGDATDAGAWALLLLAEEMVECVWTDPPYGVEYVGKTSAAMTLANDALSPTALGSLLSASLGSLLSACRSGAPWYVAAPPGPPFLPFAVVMERLKVWRQTLVWQKSTLVLGRSDYHYRHEAIFAGDAPAAEHDPLMYGWRPGAAHTWHGGRKQDTILAFDKPARNDVHPTMKPIALVQHCLRLSSSPGAVVGDPFCGSGTTLIAAAAERRIARCIELDPWYCDVIRRRWTAWAKANGQDAGPGALD